MANRIQQIAEQGQAVWLDFISRDLLRTGKLRALLNEGVTGMTSNPAIFQKSIATGRDYDDQLRELAQTGSSTYEIYEGLALRDIADAADQLRGVYEEKGGADGFVSIEVDPQLADDTEKTIAAAQRLFKTLDRPNVMIKVPATEAGVPAIRQLIGEGINVNVTLIFSIAMYEQVMQAYLDGLHALKDSGKSVNRVASVASFFVSRVDSLVDKLLTEKAAGGDTKLSTLFGQAAVANAKIAYDRYQAIFEGDSFADLRKAGARVQRPLWASTSTKNPDYPDTKYVDTLIGPNTVNTIPPDTLDAVRDHGSAARTVDMDIAESYAVVERLAGAGIRMEDVTAKLLADGVRLFADAFAKMIADIDAKRAKFV